MPVLETPLSALSFELMMYHKGEYELLEILILLRDANCAMTTTEIAKRITGKVDETTLRRIRRKLNICSRKRDSLNP